jgi:hypothetical protein
MNHRLPAIAWIAIAFGVLLSIAVGAVHYFHEPALLFMPRVWWWFDIDGLAIATCVWVIRSLSGQRAIKPLYDFTCSDLPVRD